MIERVCALAVLGLLAAAPAGASVITAWDIFAARCLEPMEEVRAPNTEGLERLSEPPAWLDVRDGEEVWGFDLDEIVLVTRGEIETEPASCALAAIGGEEDTDFAEGFVTWATAAQFEGRYAEIAASAPGERMFETQEWREPRLRVLFSPGSGRAGARAMAVETELEA